MAMTTMVRTHVLLPRELLEEVDRRCGEGKRSETIAGLLQEWLRREQLGDAIQRLMETPPSFEGPPEWRTPEGVVQWVRDLRRERSPRQERIQKWTDEAVQRAGPDVP